LALGNYKDNVQVENKKEEVHQAAKQKTGTAPFLTDLLVLYP